MADTDILDTNRALETHIHILEMGAQSTKKNQGTTITSISNLSIKWKTQEAQRGKSILKLSF